MQPHGECGREVPPRGRPRQPRVRRLGAPKPPAVQHGGPGSSGRPGGRRAPVAAVPARQPGAGREQVLLALAQPPSSPFPGPARSTSLAQTPATTGRSHWPQPRASGQRTGTPARFLNLRHDSPSRQMAQHGDQDVARSPGQTRSARPGRWTDLGSNPLRRWPAACCGQASNLAEAASHLRAGVKTGWRAQPLTVLAGTPGTLREPDATPVSAWPVGGGEQPRKRPRWHSRGPQAGVCRKCGGKGASRPPAALRPQHRAILPGPRFSQDRAQSLQREQGHAGPSTQPSACRSLAGT